MKFTDAQIEAVVAEIQAWFDPPGYTDSTWRMAAEAILAALPEPWQPIETVPDEVKKSGRYVLLVDQWKNVAKARWIGAPHFRWSIDGFQSADRPTHYMPVPELPKVP